MPKPRHQSDPATRDRARELRRASPDAERALWSHIRGRALGGFKFRRQFPIGTYYADFCCIEERLVVELDGGQHVEDVEYDTKRTAELEALGYTVLRFWNHDVLNRTEAVLEAILLALRKVEAQDARP